MKKYVFFILFFGISSLLFSQFNYNKISCTQGNFYGVLDDEDRMSAALEVVGDINGDGIEDIVAGARSDDDGGADRGAVWIMFMDSNMNVGSYQKISSTEGSFTGVLSNDDGFGCAIASLGDLDNDGIIDIVVGAWGDDDGGTNSGAVWVLFLNSDGTVKSHQKISSTQGNLVGLTTNRHFGLGLCSAEDINNDGNTDIVVGSPAYDNDGGTYRGCLWVLFLNTDGTVSAQQKINDYNGNLNITLDDYDRFGYTLSNIGDLNNDGTNDIVTSALYDDDGGADIGAVYIIFLNTNGTVKDCQKISATQGDFNGILTSDDRFGYGIAGIGDLNGDNILDIAVGAYGDDDGGTGKGAVWLIYLDTNGTCLGYDKISNTSGNFLGDLDNEDYFGVSVSCFHDINGTGGIELVVGASGDDDGGINRGAVWILFVKDHNGINTMQLNNRYILIYPNPTTGKIYLSDKEIQSIDIYGIAGQLIYSENLNSADKVSFDISNNPNGIYFLKIKTKEETYFSKIIKQ